MTQAFVWMKNHLIHHIIVIPFITMSPLHPSKKPIQKKNYRLQKEKRKQVEEREKRERLTIPKDNISHLPLPITLFHSFQHLLCFRVEIKYESLGERQLQDIL